MKNILLAVVGLSPQIITETLYALHQQQRKVDAIHVITTRRGKEMINASLFSSRDGKYFQYLREYGIAPESIAFDHDHVHTIKTNYGMEIDDITGEYENERLLSTCLNLAFKFTKHSDSAVYFCVAGGRKTMTSCLMVAAQLYGRPQDRVYHVLVSPEFENNRDFFYPPRESLLVELRDENGQRFLKETRYAHVNLIHIPFVSVRERLTPDYLQEPKDPASLLLSLVREEQHELHCDLSASKIVYRKIELDMMPARMALYAFFAVYKKECRREKSDCRGCTECYLTFAEILDKQDVIRELYQRIAGSREIAGMSTTGIGSLDAENFNSYKTKIQKDLKQRFGLQAFQELAIESTGRRPDTRYGLRIDRDKIKITF